MNNFRSLIVIQSILAFTVVSYSAQVLHAGNTGSIHAVDDHQKRLNDALIQAAREGDVDEINNLLDIGADVNATDEQGNTALITATSSSNLSAMLALIKRGAKVNARNNDGDTATMLAGQYGLPGAIELLVNTGSADLYLEDRNGDTAQVIAESQGQDEAFELLVSLTAEMSLQDLEKETNRQKKKRRTDLAVSCGDEVFNFKGPNNDPDNNENNPPMFYFL